MAVNDPPERETPPPRTLSPGATRIIGVLLVLCGGVLIYLSIYLPLQQARAHAAHLTLSDRGVWLPPVMALIGLLVIVFPKMTTFDTVLVNQNKKLSLVGWLVVAVLLAIGFGMQLWFNSQLKALGYQAWPWGAGR
jgi:hypothetical protein